MNCNEKLRTFVTQFMLFVLNVDSTFLTIEIFYLFHYIFQRSRRGGSSRSSGGGLFGRRPASTSTTPARAPASSPPAPMQQSSGGMLSGIGSTIAQGMAFGTGSAIAHRAVGAVAGSMSGGDSDPQIVASEPGMQQQQQQPQICGPDKQLFFECLQVNRGDQQACAFLYDALQTCQRESQMNTFK